ncbi:MAG: aspartate aminotransferase family protein, partial [Paracoccus sp. (in: a-proteobacteria)]|nr:aspartate aminotransferase family protein [Paracoccus sp. (in: a-proteobacteria)]
MNHMPKPAPNDLRAFWMPFTANRQFKAAPRMLTGARDMHYTAQDGRQILDGTAGLWCVNAGHCRPKITEAIAAQAGALDYAPAFQMGHPSAFELANRIVDLAPDGLDHVFYANSGSEAVETALKIAIAYHRARGEGARTRLIGRERGYHGVNFGGISVGGIVNNRKMFGTLLAGVDHMPHTHLAQNAFTRGQPEHGAELADDLERIVALHGAETIAAVIVEPMAGSTGVLMPPKGYLERLREITRKHGILLIFDEVITGFGRLGAPFAAQKFGVTPDMITCAKGLTNGVIPMGAVLASAEIHDAFMNGPEHMIELFHGYTYSGNPVACAAGLATLDVYAEEDLFARADRLSGAWEEALHVLRDLPHVVDIRNMGLVGAVELAPLDGQPGKRGFDAFLRAF